jgi:hypothetical protein
MKDLEQNFRQKFLKQIVLHKKYIIKFQKLVKEVFEDFLEKNKK